MGYFDLHREMAAATHASAAGIAEDATQVVDARALLREAITRVFHGRIAVVSSFGAESALLLAMVAEIESSVPVLFLETGKHFPETIEYVETLTRHLGLTDVRLIRPDPAVVAYEDPADLLHQIDPDTCCAIRKVDPLERALAPFAAWISGRKRHQAATRRAMHAIEADNGHVKINALADWTAADIAAESARLGLPPHPLVEQGYASIGCAVCTRPVAPGEDPRAGRWAGKGKIECGIHRPAGGLTA